MLSHIPAVHIDILPFLPESQSKELAEMLAQEDLGEMGLSSPSEQVAYLLVERATLLERLEAAERRLESQSITGNFREAHHQVRLICVHQRTIQSSSEYQIMSILKCFNG